MLVPSRIEYLSSPDKNICEFIHHLVVVQHG